MVPEQEVSAIFEVLKVHLKGKKISYSDLGEALGMSESNVKRIFSAKSCSLVQLAQICAAAEISMSDLVAIADKQRSPVIVLTKEAEDFFLKQFDCFIFYNNLSRNPKAFLAQTDLPKERVSAYLKALEKLGMIRFRKGNVEIVGSGYLAISSAPRLLRMTKEKWVPWFLDQTLRHQDDPRYFLKVASTGLSPGHRAQLAEELEQLVKRYLDIGYQDQFIGGGEYESVGICIGLGPHRVGLFEKSDTPGGLPGARR